MLQRPVAGDGVGFPLVGVDRRAAQLFQARQAAEMRAVRMRHDDPLQVAGRAAELRDLIQDAPRVDVEQGVNQGQIHPIVDQERVYVRALSLPRK